MLIILIEYSSIFSLIQFDQKYDLDSVHYKIDFYTLVQHISMNLILISIINLNIRISKT
jgi:hypothetical protein